jgi:hypothetical protein
MPKNQDWQIAQRIQAPRITIIGTFILALICINLSYTFRFTSTSIYVWANLGIQKYSALDKADIAGYSAYRRFPSDRNVRLHVEHRRSAPNDVGADRIMG